MAQTVCYYRRLGGEIQRGFVCGCVGGWVGVWVRAAAAFSLIVRIMGRAAGSFYAATLTSPTVCEGSGTGSPSSRSPRMWNSMALWMRFSTDGFVLPTAKQPGKSGTYAPQLLGPSS